MTLTFADFKDIGFISNQLTSSLIDKNGNVLWLCFPRFDSDPFIAYLLDENNGGVFRISPKAQFSSLHKYTAPNVLHTNFKTSEGSADINDFLIPGKTIFMRDINSEITLQLNFNPLFGFHTMNFNYSENNGKMMFDSKNGKGRLVLEIVGEFKKTADFTWEIEKGLTQVILSYYPSAEIYELEGKNISSSNLSKAIDSTIDYWGAYAERIKLSLSGTDLEEFDPLLRSSIFTILGLTYSPTGSIIAAPTASLPEDPGGNRNWDYRYVWVRDSAIMASTLCRLDFYMEGRRALEFLFSMIDYSGKPLYNLYKVDGTEIYGERYIDSLNGFMNSKPVRVGNRATNQIQLDIEGEFLYAVNGYFESTHDKDFIQNHSRAIEYIADWLSDNWQLADSGIWEKPEDHEYAHSKVMIWVALENAGKLISALGGIDRWKETRDEIKKWIMSNCVKEGYFVTFPKSNEVDSTVLAFPIYGFVDVNDPVFLKTLKVVEKTLFVKGFVYRYNFDSIGKANHAFVLCSMWLASVYSRLKRKNDALQLLKNVKSIVGSNNLIGEDIDVHNKVFTGNFPQGFVHATFINSIIDILSNN